MSSWLLASAEEEEEESSSSELGGDGGWLWVMLGGLDEFCELGEIVVLVVKGGMEGVVSDGLVLVGDVGLLVVERCC